MKKAFPVGRAFFMIEIEECFRSLNFIKFKVDSSLASCILITIRMYIDRKGWDVPNIAVNTNMYEETKDNHTTIIIDRDILFLSEIDDEKKTRIFEIVKHCPISKILTGDTKVR